MSLESVLNILSERGLSLSLRHDGTPIVAGPREEITAAVRDALTAYRADIVARLRAAPRQREVLMGTGEVLGVCSHVPAGEFPPEGLYWRWVQGVDWWPIAARTWTGEPTERQKEYAISPTSN